MTNYLNIAPLKVKTQYIYLLLLSPAYLPWLYCILQMDLIFTPVLWYFILLITLLTATVKFLPAPLVPCGACLQLLLTSCLTLPGPAWPCRLVPIDSSSSSLHRYCVWSARHVTTTFYLWVQRGTCMPSGASRHNLEHMYRIWKYIWKHWKVFLWINILRYFKKYIGNAWIINTEGHSVLLRKIHFLERKKLEKVKCSSVGRVTILLF